jgi:hypothetical protein
VKKPRIKQGLPVEKKTIFAAVFIVVILLSAVAGTNFVNFGKANPFSPSKYSGEMAPPANATPPSITIIRPINNKIYNENFVNLTLNAVVGQAPHSLSSYVFRHLALTEVYYEADWLENETVVDGTSEFSYVYNSSGTSENFYGRTTGSYSCDLKLEGIPEGNHIITVNAIERGYYFYVEGGLSFKFYSFSISAISSVTFTVDTTPPEVSILSLENKTYSTSDVPFSFNASEPVSQITYSLDGEENVAITGNTTLTGLANGDHTLTVYAKDEAGNVGTSETISFTVNVLPVTLIAAVSGASVTIAALGLFCYFRKRGSKL